MKKRIALFASGNGTNVQRIAEYFSGDNKVTINRIYSNVKNAFVLERAKKLGINYLVFDKDIFYHSDEILKLLEKEQTDLIILAGFLWLIPDRLIQSFPNRIINIHPALLPKYGGKGMYGHHIHEAVIKAGETESGITIHYVNENYDEGQIIFQATCPVDQSDSADSLATRIHKLEHKHFPEIIEKVLKDLS